MAFYLPDWSCCGLWLFGRPRNRYSQLPEEPETFECPDRWRAEIDLGLPPGVQVGDLLRNEQTMGSLRQVYLLAVQANSITDHLKRFDAVRVPESCRGVVEAQVAKLEAVRSVIWNTMISLAVSGIEMDENALKALLDKQAGDSLALMEMEKVATALKMDETGAWAQEISAVVSSVTAPSASAPFINSAFEPEVPTPVLAPPPVVRQPEHSGPTELALT
ncbi:BSRF1 protein [human gammaherpesvirus 4]|nr:BSRF1 protein [human gammaherpesvirus 4]